jgi:hypothetical protein
MTAYGTIGGSASIDAPCYVGMSQERQHMAFPVTPVRGLPNLFGGCRTRSGEFHRDALPDLAVHTMGAS